MACGSNNLQFPPAFATRCGDGQRHEVNSCAGAAADRYVEAAPLHQRGKPRIQRIPLDAPKRDTGRRYLILLADLTIFTTLFGGDERLDRFWTNIAIPKEGYFKPEQRRFGPIFPKTPANYGFTIIAKIKPSWEETIRQYGKTIEKGIADDPSLLAPLKLHYLRWVLFDINDETYFMYQGIFDLISTSSGTAVGPSTDQRRPLMPERVRLEI
jgi:hypothetical protein